MMKNYITAGIGAPYRYLKNAVLRFNKGDISNPKDKLDESGFLYIVSGIGYTKECVFSIRSLKQHNDEKVCVFAEEQFETLFEGITDYFYPINSKIKRPKVEYISQSPFNKTVYLDSDTYIDMNISDLFDLLDKFDFCASFCHSRKRENYAKSIKKYSRIPYSFSEVNSGVMAYNDSAATKELWKKWHEYYYEYINKTSGWDQPSLRVALWESNVKIAYLPPEYNNRPTSILNKVRQNKTVLGYSHLEPRIYHSHYSPEVHQGKFNLDDVDELKKILKKTSIPITA